MTVAFTPAVTVALEIPHVVVVVVVAGRVDVVVRVVVVVTVLTRAMHRQPRGSFYNTTLEYYDVLDQCPVVVVLVHVCV